MCWGVGWDFIYRQVCTWSCFSGFRKQTCNLERVLQDLFLPVPSFSGALPAAGRSTDLSCSGMSCGILISSEKQCFCDMLE